MSKFCGSCGSPHSGGKFCASCGAPLPPPATQAAPPQQPAPVQAPPTQEAPQAPAAAEPAGWAPQTASAPDAGPSMSGETVIRPYPTPPPGWTGHEAAQSFPASPAAQPYPPADGPAATGPAPTQGYPTGQAGWPGSQGASPFPPGTAPTTGAMPVAAPGVQAENPFLGVPASDYVRDTAALVLLFSALGVRWDMNSDGGDHWWVVLTVLASAVSLLVPYVAASKVLPALGGFESRLVKLALNAPLVAAVLVTLVQELVNIDHDFRGGIGIGVALALAGASLAAQPRASEVDASGQGGVWATAGSLLAVATVLLGLLAFALFVIDDLTAGDGQLFEEPLAFVSVLLALPASMLVVLGLPLVRMLGGSQAWRRVFATSAFGVLGGLLLSQANDGDSFVSAVTVEKWNSPSGGTFLLGAAAALAVSHVALARSARTTSHGAYEWVRTASGALLVSTLALVVSAVTLVVELLWVDDMSAAAIVLIVLLLISAGLLGVCIPMLVDPRKGRPLALGLITAELVVAVIIVSVGQGTSEWYLGDVTAYTFTALFVLPVLAMLALTLPASVRSALGPLVSPQPAPMNQPVPPQQPYGQPQSYNG